MFNGFFTGWPDLLLTILAFLTLVHGATALADWEEMYFAGIPVRFPAWAVFEILAGFFLVVFLTYFQHNL
jgi:hypothetical protein